MLTKSLGSWGEDMAVRYLKDVGFMIRHRNFNISLGDADIIASDKDNGFCYRQGAATVDLARPGSDSTW